MRRTAPRRFQKSVHARCVCVPACPFRRDFASAGRSPKAVPEKRVAARSSEGNSSCITKPECLLRWDFASAGSESEAHSSNSPGTGQNHNFFDINMLEIQGLPGDTNLASPGKSLFAMIMIIRWLQIRGLPGDSYEFCKRSEVFF